MSELTRQDIQDRYGSFLAIRWPDGNYSEYDHFTVLQDIFPAVFAFMYEDVSILSAEIAPVIPLDNHNSGISVDNGTIIGGINNGEPLFLSGE